MKPVIVDLSQTSAIDARFLGLLLMVNKKLRARGSRLSIEGVTLRMQTLLRLHGVEYLLSSETGTAVGSTSSTLAQSRVA